VGVLDPELTVLIPCFANRDYLRAAIESALASPAVAVILADDASGPEEHRILARYAVEYPERVRVIRSEKQRGIQKNLNGAVEQVRTRYFVRLDCDDVLYPGHVEHALGLLRARPALALVAGKEQRIGAGECLEFRSAAMEAYPAGPAVKAVSGVEAYRFIVQWRPNPCSSGTVYRTSAVRAIGGFDVRVPWADDWEVWLRLASRWEVAYVDAPAALYRIHPQSTTSLYLRQNRLCYGYDYIYRRAAELCREPAVLPDLRRAFLRLAKYYAGAAWRLGRRLHPEALRCGANGVRALWTACLMFE
jgi:cellulose synthase/poly-beta-1,6-N-acetylglucosamine synthase-like glycosyltransferase